MAIKFLQHISLENNQLQNARLQILATNPTGVEGQIIYNSTTNSINFHTGSGWITLDGSGDISEVTAGGGLTGGGTAGAVTLDVGRGKGIIVNANDVAVDYSGNNNVIVVASAGTGQIATDSQLIISAVDGTVYKHAISDLPFTNTTGTVTSVDTSNGTFINVTGGEITTTGTITADLSASGTPSATTFLRGDNTWASTGTVTSVDITPDKGITATGGPITGSGSITVGLDYAGADNFILSATDSVDPVTTEDKIAISSSADNNVYEVSVAQLPFTDNTGTVTSVGGNGGLTGTVTTTGNLSLKNNANFSDATILKWDDTNSQLVDSIITADDTTVTIGGNLTVTGTTTQVNSTIVTIGDNMIKLAKDNTENGSDIGWFGKARANATDFYPVFFYDAIGSNESDAKFKLGVTQTEPTGTVSNLLTGTLEARFIGPLTGNASTATTLATARNFKITGDGDAPNVSFDGSGAVNLVLTLDTVNSNVGTFGDANSVAQVTVNGKGLVTAATNVDIAIPSTQVTDFGTAVNALVAKREHAETIGDGALTQIPVEHNLGTTDVIVQVYSNSAPYDTIWTEVQRLDDLNTVMIITAEPIALNGARVLITKIG